MIEARNKRRCAKAKTVNQRNERCVIASRLGGGTAEDDIAGLSIAKADFLLLQSHHQQEDMHVLSRGRVA